MSNEKRSRWRPENQIDWVGGVDVRGVGARHGEANSPARGGGYLNGCNAPQVWEEAKFRELAEMGLPQIWLTVARDIGYDNFMVMWRRLDAAIEFRSDAESMIEVQLRRYSSFQRYQRNRFIEALAPFFTNTEIKVRVKRELNEDLSLNHVRRLANKRRVGST